MKLVGAGGQQVQHYLYDASGTITAGNTAQLALARSQSRSFLLLQNLSPGPLYVEIGHPRATATITNGAVTAVAVTNVGFGFTRPPRIMFLGGGNDLGGGVNIDRTYRGLGQPGGSSPSNPARASVSLTGGAVSGVTITNPGSGYVTPPYVMFQDSALDPFGCAVPSAASGILLPAQGEPLIFNGTCCPTDAVAIFGATTGQAFTLKWMD